ASNSTSRTPSFLAGEAVKLEALNLNYAPNRSGAGIKSSAATRADLRVTGLLSWERLRCGIKIMIMIMIMNAWLGLENAAFCRGSIG
ncbi:MAG TPA: hypothetical protein PLV92_13225, partial [Pirellulaceae bacterium]|nr:hypothetical protein [Pirellulaceae bacterium]